MKPAEDNLLKSKGDNPYKVFTTSIANDFTQVNKTFSSMEYVDYCLKMYDDYLARHSFTRGGKRSLTGSIFELIVATELYRKGIYPMYLQACVEFVPNIVYDILLFKGPIPIVLSLKTSLRERFKQADLEALAIRNVHRKAENYLITLNKTEAKNMNRLIVNDDVFALKEVIVANSERFNEFVNSLSKNIYTTPAMIHVVKTGTLVD